MKRINESEAAEFMKIVVKFDGEKFILDGGGALLISPVSVVHDCWDVYYYLLDDVDCKI